MNRFLKTLLTIFMLFMTTPIFSQNRIIVRTPEGIQEEAKYAFIPFGFYNTQLQAAFGGAFSAQGIIQDQMFGQIIAIASTNGSFLSILKVDDVKLPFSNRVFFSNRSYFGKLSTIEFYRGFNSKFPDEIAGDNESSMDNFQEASGNDFDVALKFRYLLPIGHAKENPIARIEMQDGVVIAGKTGGDSWNPIRSGRSYFEINPFFRSQNFTSDSGDFDIKTAGITLGLIFDNTDFSENPKRGSYKRIAFSKDWGKLGSSKPWESMEVEYAKFFNLGKGEKTRQRVLAFNFWTSHALSWHGFDLDSEGNKVFHRPPNHKGSRLGGIERMKGFVDSRFSDRSAIYYSLEYRHTPKWNPIGKRRLFGSTIDVSWLQWVGFFEVGRVAPEWDLSVLHENMKWDAGLGIRAWINNILTRLDLGYSSEGSGVQMTIEHPFPSNF